jgi:hypothetical protein
MTWKNEKGRVPLRQTVSVMQSHLIIFCDKTGANLHTIHNFKRHVQKNIFLTCFIVSIFQLSLSAQKDTEFWFVAPETSQHNSNLDRPVAFRYSTYGLPAKITVSQPANPAFTVQILNIAANTSGALFLPAPIRIRGKHTP